jgi:oxygen-dependent protoporphyrinogen oxidase
VEEPDPGRRGEQPAPRHVAVVGGGIAGLAAALRLRDRAPAGTIVTILEQSPQVGGKLRTGAVGGHPVEEGADAFVLRAPQGRALVERVGLTAELVHPTASGAAVALPAGLRPLPSGTVLGIPGDLEALADSGILSDAGLAHVRGEPEQRGEPLHDDVAVGTLVRRRLGAEVLDRLVDPLLGGVYAGRADGLSLRATLPGVAEALAGDPSLVHAARRLASTGGPAGPVFGAVRGGMSQLVTAVAHASGAGVRTGATVRELHPTRTGWRLTVGSTRDPEYLLADAVVLATPAAPATRLLAATSPAAAGEVGEIAYASVALVSLLLPGDVRLPAGTGALVPAGPDRLVKAVTYVGQKWRHLAPAGACLLRASVGRFGEATALHLDDDALVSRVHADLAAVLARPGGLPAPRAATVTRWGGALPQYAVGHLDRVARIRRSLAGHPTLALAGAAYDGVGVPACVGSGQAAADAVLAALRRAPVPAGRESGHASSD